MGFLTWTLLPLTLLGGVPFPSSNYDSTYVQRKLYCTQVNSGLCLKNIKSIGDRLELTKLFSSWRVVASASTVTKHQDNTFRNLEEKFKKVRYTVGPWTSVIMTARRQKRDVPRTQRKVDSKSSSTASTRPEDTHTLKTRRQTPNAVNNFVRRTTITKSRDVENFSKSTDRSRDPQFEQELTFSGTHAYTQNLSFNLLAPEEKTKDENRIDGSEFERVAPKKDVVGQKKASTNSTATKNNDALTKVSNNAEFDDVATGAYENSSNVVSTDITLGSAGTHREIEPSTEARLLPLHEVILFRRTRNAHSDISDDQQTALNTKHSSSNYSTTGTPNFAITSTTYSTDRAPKLYTNDNEQATDITLLSDRPVPFSTQTVVIGNTDPINTVEPGAFTLTPEDQSGVSMPTVVNVLSTAHPTHQSTVSFTMVDTVGATSASKLTSVPGEFINTDPIELFEHFTSSPKVSVTIPNSIYESPSSPTGVQTGYTVTNSYSTLESGVINEIPVHSTAESGQPTSTSYGSTEYYTKSTQEQTTSLPDEGTAEINISTMLPAEVTSSTTFEGGLYSEVAQLTTQGNQHVTEPRKLDPEARTPSDQVSHKTEAGPSTTYTLAVRDHHQRTTAGLVRTESTEKVETITPNPASTMNTLLNNSPSSIAITETSLLTTVPPNGIEGTFRKNPPPLDEAEKLTTLVSLSPIPSLETSYAPDTETKEPPVDEEISPHSLQTTMQLATTAPNTQEDNNEAGRPKPEEAPTMNLPEVYPSINSVRVRLGLDANYNRCVRGREWQFREHIRRQLSVLLRVPLPGIRNVRVRAGSILVHADMVPVKTSTLELDKSALLAARRDLQERIDSGTVVVTDLDGNRLPVFTSTVYSLQPPHGTSYSPALLGALTAMFLAAASVIVASSCLAKKHIGERHVSPSPERESDLEQPVEPQFLRLVSPSLLMSTRLEDPASASILRDVRMLPRRSLVPDPPVYKPVRNGGEETPATPPPPVLGAEPSERLSVVSWQSHSFESPVSTSDAFSLKPWSTTPSQSRSETEYRPVGSDITSRWTVTPSEQLSPPSQSGSEKTTSRVALSEKRMKNGLMR